jgi:hypothetical protein
MWFMDELNLLDRYNWLLAILSSASPMEVLIHQQADIYI